MKMIEQFKAVPKYNFVGFVTIMENNVPFPKRVLSILKRIPITFCNELSSNIRELLKTQSFRHGSIMKYINLGKKSPSISESLNTSMAQSPLAICSKTLSLKLISPVLKHLSERISYVQSVVQPALFIQYSVKAVLDGILHKRRCT